VALDQFCFARRNDLVSELHRLALTAAPDAPAGRITRGQKLMAKAMYFAVTLRQIFGYHRTFGAFVHAHHGVSHAQQLADLWHCMWRHNQLARHYYWRKLFLIRDREEWLANFEHREVNTLLDHINAAAPKAALTHKLHFHQHCRTHDLPTAPVFAAWEPGGHLVTPLPPDPRRDVFIKPTTEYGSVGAMPIAYDAATRLYQLGDARYSWSDLLDTIGTQHAEKIGYVLQPRLRNSANYAVYGQQDLCNLRVVTGVPANGIPELVGSVIRLPSRFTTKGHDRDVLLATVDIADGRMGRAMFRNIKLPQFTHHPDTGHPIEGEILPGWSEIKELVLRAHATCPWMAFIGWDVVESEQGLLLLEANANWGGDSIQLPGTTPLGRTRFPTIYFERLRSGSPKPGPAQAATFQVPVREIAVERFT
jgi:hypothetical protein